MPSATFFLLGGVIAAVVLGFLAWLRNRGPRSPVRSVDAFEDAMRAIAPDRSPKRR